MAMTPPQGGVTFESEASSAMALLFLLPVVDLAPRFPGLDPWVRRAADRIGREGRADIRLITVVLSQGLDAAVNEPGMGGAAEALLAALAETPAMALQAAALRRLAQHGRAVGASGGDPRALLQEPARLRQRIAAAVRPSAEEPFPIDVDRALTLLERPEEMKALLMTRLGSLWQDHLRPQWERALPAVEQAAAAARRHFAAGGVDDVVRAVTGRPAPADLADHLACIRQVVFHPTPFLGPYVAVATDLDAGVARVGYGVGIGSGAGLAGEPGAAALPGGLLPALTALADETRLQILAMVRAQGQGCAQDFISGLGLSQPATSRRLRLLESTGLLTVERADGVKWYRISPERAAQVADALRAFLAADERKGP